MSKRPDTLELENALIRLMRSRREYGCEEVTIGFSKDGWGGRGCEIVDFMGVDANKKIYCYEIKVTLEDLKSSAKKSWVGHYNYLVVSEDLWALGKNPWVDTIPEHIGIKVGKGLRTTRKAKKQKLTEEQEQLLILSLTRSLYWKMDKFRKLLDIETIKKYKKEIHDLEKENKELTDKYLYYRELDYEMGLMTRSLDGESKHIRDILEDRQDEIFEKYGRKMILPPTPKGCK